MDRDATQWRISLKLYVTVPAATWYLTQSDQQERIKQAFDAHKILPSITPIARSRVPDIQKELNGVDEQSLPKQ